MRYKIKLYIENTDKTANGKIQLKVAAKMNQCLNNDKLEYFA